MQRFKHLFIFESFDYEDVAWQLFNEFRTKTELNVSFIFLIKGY
jgi:hypothetical protein